MERTVPIIINVFKNCETCKHLSFLETTIDKPEIAECLLTKKIVTDETHDSSIGIVYKDIECDNWGFDKRLLDDSSYFIELETSQLDLEEQNDYFK